MLSELQIDDRIQYLISLQTKMENIVINTIANRLKDIKTMTPSDIYKLERLFKSGSDTRKINKEISKLTKLSENEIKKIIKEVAADSYKDVKPFYNYNHKSYIPFEDNIPLQTELKAIQRLTLDEFKGISNSTAFMLRDFSNPLILHQTPLSKVYNTVIDSAIFNIVSGTGTYNTLIPDTIRQLSDSGIKAVEYTSKNGKKRVMRLDTVVRRNILNGIRNVQQEIQTITGEQFGADGIELSVHQYSAPDHEPVQGHQFTLENFEKMQLGEDFEDVNGIKFKGFERPIGAYNCRHFAYHIVIGHKTPNYSLKELDELKQKNADGFKTKDKEGNPVTKSMYWCTQRRNQYELTLKKLKEGEQAAEIAQETKLKDNYTRKINEKQQEYAKFCYSCGLKPRFERTRI